MNFNFSPSNLFSFLFAIKRDFKKFLISDNITFLNELIKNKEFINLMRGDPKKNEKLTMVSDFLVLLTNLGEFYSLMCQKIEDNLDKWKKIINYFKSIKTDKGHYFLNLASCAKSYVLLFEKTRINFCPSDLTLSALYRLHNAIKCSIDAASFSCQYVVDKMSEWKEEGFEENFEMTTYCSGYISITPWPTEIEMNLNFPNDLRDYKIDTNEIPPYERNTIISKVIQKVSRSTPQKVERVLSILKYIKELALRNEYATHIATDDFNLFHQLCKLFVSKSKNQKNKLN